MTASKAARAGISVAMLVGFYLIGIGLIAALVIVNLVMWESGRINIRLALAMLVVGWVVIRAIFFVKGGFEGVPGGIRVTESDQPQLFGEIESIAGQMNTTVPDEVYLVHDVNAFVVEDTRFLGLVSKKRVMAIGVALMNLMTVDELRSVIAHEFGHYAGSDTRLGAVTYRGWESITRAIGGFGQGLIRAIFVGYAKLYLRVTGSLSRGQELEADRWGARLGGRDAAMTALGKLDHGATAYSWYLDTFVGRLADRGVRPVNLFEGYRGFLAAPERQDDVSEWLRANPRAHSPYDTHPPASERVAALSRLPETDHVPDDRPARMLLTDPDAIEAEVTGVVLRADLEAVDWTAAVPHLYDVQAKIGSSVREITGLTASEVFELLEAGRAEDVRDRMASRVEMTASDDPRADIHGAVRGLVIEAMGPRAHATVDFGHSMVGDGSGERLTQALLAGGERARQARQALGV